MTTATRKYWFGTIGTLLGALALLAAVTPVWILPALQPPPPLSQVVVDTAEEIKDRMLAKAQGKEYEAPRPRADLYGIFTAIGVTLGVLAVICSGISRLSREPRRFAMVSAALGGGALVLQFSVLFAGVLVVGLIAAALMSGEVGLGA